MNEEKRQKFIQRARSILIADKTLKDIDIDYASGLICDWFDKNKRSIDSKSYRKIIDKAREKKKVNEEFRKVLIKSKELGFH